MSVKTTVKALAIGLLVDVTGTEVGTFVAYLIFGAVWLGTGHKLEAATKLLADSILAAVAYLVFGLLCTMLGAYVTARLAEREKLRHALGMGFLSELISLAMILFSRDSTPTWYLMLASVLVLPAALVGGYFGTILRRPRLLMTQVLAATSVLVCLLAAFLIVVALRGG